MAAVVNTDVRLLATVRLSSLVSCSTRWCLRRAWLMNQTIQLLQNHWENVVDDRHSLLLCCLQLLHSLVIAMIHFLLQELAMVLHRLHLLCPTLFLSGQLLLKHRHAEISHLQT